MWLSLKDLHTNRNHPENKWSSVLTTDVLVFPPAQGLQGSVNIRELLEGEITEGDVKEKDTEKRK